MLFSILTVSVEPPLLIHPLSNPDLRVSHGFASPPSVFPKVVPIFTLPPKTDIPNACVDVLIPVVPKFEIVLP